MDNNEYVQFIGHDELDGLKEVRDLCFFGAKEKQEEKEFWSAILKAGQCNALHEMHFDNFEAAYVVARSILFKRGEAILKKSA